MALFERSPRTGWRSIVACPLSSLIVNIPSSDSSPPLSHNGCSDVEQPHKACNNTVRNDLTLTRCEPQRRIVSKKQTKATIDHAQSDSEPTKPQMPIRPERAALVFLVLQMVYVAHDGLEEQRRKQDEADNRMVFVE